MRLGVVGGVYYVMQITILYIHYFQSRFSAVGGATPDYTISWLWLRSLVSYTTRVKIGMISLT